MSGKGEGAALDDLEVIIPNLKKRYSGGTAVNRTIAPLIAERCRTAWLGPDRPQGVAGLSVADLLRLRFRQPGRRPARIWHARRNSEMLLGLVLKRLGWKLKLIFNSAGQRTKTRYTGFLVARMDAVIATSETSASFVAAVRRQSSITASTSKPTGRRLTGSRLSRPPAFRANMGSGRSAACGVRRASISSSRPRAGFCRNIRTSPVW